MYSRDELKEIVNKAIFNLELDSEVPALFEPVKYILSSGGKRIRPVMTLMATNLFTEKIEDAILPAVGLEIFHNFTLMHDDIMDNAAVRRNNPTAHVKWNVNRAILSGDVMAFVANDCITHVGADKIIPVIRTFNELAVGVCKGQQMDMDFESVKFVSEENYLRMIELKTAVLIGGALKIGAIIGGADEAEAELLYSFGRSLGLAFQIQDDILDSFGDQNVFGKEIGGDIVSNKKTILLIKALELASGKQLQLLDNLLNDRSGNSEEKIRLIKEIYIDLGVMEYATAKASTLAGEAYGLLGELKIDTDRKKFLSDLATELISRKS